MHSPGRAIAIIPFVVLTTAFSQWNENCVDFIEEFNSKGKPFTYDGMQWKLKAEMNPDDSWNDFFPGDGYAHVTIDHDPSNDADDTNPFQYFEFGNVGPNHILEFRAKNVAVPGVAGFIFTYQEDPLIDEIDIEIVPDDDNTSPVDHPVGTDGGWTDARFNTWANSVTESKNHVSHKKTVKNQSGDKISLIDDEFHTYTIDWVHTPGGDGREGTIEFYIDGVFQDSITSNVPDSPARVIFGYRQMSWTGDIDWKGTHTMLVDWVRAIPVDINSPTAIKDLYEVKGELFVNRGTGVLNNDTGDNIKAKLLTAPEHGTVDLNNNGSFTYSADPGFTGTDFFTYYADNGEEKGKSNAAVVELSVTESNSVQVEQDIVPENVVSLTYSDGFIHFNPLTGGETVEIYSVVGKKVLEQSAVPGRGINVSALSKGVYLVKLYTDMEEFRTMFLKK